MPTTTPRCCATRAASNLSRAQLKILPEGLPEQIGRGLPGLAARRRSAHAQRQAGGTHRGGEVGGSAGQRRCGAGARVAVRRSAAGRGRASLSLRARQRRRRGRADREVGRRRAGPRDHRRVRFAHAALGGDRHRRGDTGRAGRRCPGGGWRARHPGTRAATAAVRLPSSCAQDDVDEVARTWNISGAVAGVGGGMLGAALLVWLLGDGDAPSEGAHLEAGGLTVSF